MTNDIETQAKIEFETDGTIVRGKDGYCMDIFSTVSYLNDRLAEIEKLQAENKELKEQLVTQSSWEKQEASLFNQNKKLQVELEEQKRINQEQFCKLVDSMEREKKLRECIDRAKN